jgi:beta-glucosidase
MKTILLGICSSILLSSTCLAQTKLPYKNAALPIEQRVKDLLSRMTVEEKAGQLNQLNGGSFTGPALNDAGQKDKMNLVKQGKVGSMLNVIGSAETKAIQDVAMQSRLGIPLIFGLDVIHGYKTIFPIPLAEACSWDVKQIEKNASVAAKEAAAGGIHWTFAPMCDISNDPRWGRVMEGAGEDPFLGATIAAARVKGLQGNLNDNKHILACIKHFAVYGAVEAGKEYNTVDVSRVQLWNKYLPPYKAAVDAGAASLMNAFNIFEGVPASGNKYLLNDVLKKKWGYKGFIVSDWGSFAEMITHGYATDGKDAALKAIQAGSQMDMESKVSYLYLPQLLKEGKVTMKQIDDAIATILMYKFKLGLFDNANAFSNEAYEKENLFTAENKAEARKAASGSIVLLKNKNILPLQKNKKIAVVGLYANSKEDMFDFWVAQGVANDAVTTYEGLQKVYNNITFCNGYNNDNTTNETLINEAVKNATDAEVIVVNIGISGKMAGEDRALTNPTIPAGQIELLKALKKIGKPIVVLVSSGRPLILTEAEPLADAIVQCWILGSEHGNAVADVVSGIVNPSAKTVMTFPYAIGQIPIYYNSFNTGRPGLADGSGGWNSRYRDAPNEPLYPFGFGLSYSSFSYTELNTTVKNNDKNIVTVKTTITNTSNVDGEEIVQLYIRDYAASIVRPIKELKAYQKIKLKAGESRELVFNLTKKDLSFFDADGNEIFEKGKFAVFVGSNSKEVKQSDFEVK